MVQDWFRRHPVSVYPRGNAKNLSELTLPRFGTLSPLQLVSKGRSGKCGVVGAEPTEEAFVDVMLHLLSFVAVDDLCRLSAVCTGWYCFIHASDTFKQAHGILSPTYTRYEGSWKETAIRHFIDVRKGQQLNPTKRARVEGSTAAFREFVKFVHHPVAVKRRFYNDHLFQAWICTILPCHYHLRPPITAASRNTHLESTPSSIGQYCSVLKEVPRRRGLSPDEFRAQFEAANLPVVLTDLATEWPIFKILQGKFENLALKREELFRPGTCSNIPMRCEHTTMSIVDYVRYAQEQTDERPIYLFDSEFGDSMDVELLYCVPEHFARDDFFKVLGSARPKYRWIIAGPRRGGSSFHVDPNYTSAWNANLTGLKRWILLPPGHTPDGVFPSEDMSEVMTPVSLTEWLLNHYDATVEKWRNVAYECVCKPGDIMFIPCGWWHFVINLEDSVAITQNYVSGCNLPSVLKFLSVMKSSISGIGEDVDDCAAGQAVERRRANFAEEFSSAMLSAYPDLMQSIQCDTEREAREKYNKKSHELLAYMGFLTKYYEKLAEQGRLERLLTLCMFDERVYEVVDRYKLACDIAGLLPSPQAAIFLSRGMAYDCVSEEVLRNFIKICMMLSTYKTVEEGASLSELIGSCGIPEEHRMSLFNFSETYRHMILSKSYFPQRSVLKLLSYIFCDDVLSDAVAQLQYKSDILNHVNKVYVDTPDFTSWRFSVRVLSLAGGYNEDRSDVEYTEALTRLVTRALPEFIVYFGVTFVYAMIRHYPRRVRGITPRWLARHRAMFSATYCAFLGVFVNSVLEYRLHKHRMLYEQRKSQECRRRKGAERRGTLYTPNAYFNNLEGVTRHIYSMQLTTYGVTASMLIFSLVPLTPITFPRWMGDVAWRHPFVPRLFPAVLGMHTASRCMVPFIFAPFTILTATRFNGWTGLLYDRYVELRMRLWHRRVETFFDTSADVADLDVTKEWRRKGTPVSN